MSDIIIDSCFCIIFFSVPVVALRFLPFAGISIYKFSIPSLFIIFYFIFAYAGILPLYFGWDKYSIYLGVVDKNIIFKMFVYSSVALLMVIVGFLYANKVLGLRANFSIKTRYEETHISQIYLNICLLLMCVLVLLAYLQKLDSIAFFKIINGDFAGAAVARSNMGNSFSGKYWRYQLFMRYLLDYTVVMFFADYLMKRTRVAAILFYTSFSLAFFTATMALEKGPLAGLLIMLYLVYVILKGGRYWQKTTKYFLVTFISLVVLSFIYSVGGLTDGRTLTSQIFRILSRVFTGQISPVYFYFEMFPAQIDYLMGLSFPNPGGILPFENFPLVTEVSKYIYPQDIELNVVGSAPTVFWGEMYANFGPIAVIVSSFLVGLGLFVISHILTKFPFSSPSIAAIVALAYHYITLTSTSLSNYFLDIPVILIMLVTMAHFMCIRVRKKPSNLSGSLLAGGWKCRIL